MRAASTIYDAEPFERERKDQAERDRQYVQNKAVLDGLRHHLDALFSEIIGAHMSLNGIDLTLTTDDLDDAYLELATAEKENGELA